MLVMLSHWFIVPVRADQTDTRLPDLFERLGNAPNRQTAAIIAENIWAIWAMKPEDRKLEQMLAQGTDAMNAQKYREAEAIFTAIIKADPDFAEAWNKRATVYFLMGAFAASKRDIAQTILREPQHFGALSGLGLIEMHLGDYQAAKQAYMQARNIHPFIDGHDDIIQHLEQMIKGTAL